MGTYVEGKVENIDFVRLSQITSRNFWVEKVVRLLLVGDQPFSVGLTQVDLSPPLSAQIKEISVSNGWKYVHVADYLFSSHLNA